MHLHERSESASLLAASIILRHTLTDQKQVVLDEVMFKAFHGQRAISHPSHKVMMRVCFPWRLNIFTVEEVIDEAASRSCQPNDKNWVVGAYGANGSVYVE